MLKNRSLWMECGWRNRVHQNLAKAHRFNNSKLTIILLFYGLTCLRELAVILIIHCWKFILFLPCVRISSLKELHLFSDSYKTRIFYLGYYLLKHVK